MSFTSWGRTKDLLIVYGRNHSPDDIEATVQEISRGQVAAISVPDDRTEHLVVIVEHKKHGNTDEEAMQKLESVKHQVTSAISQSHGLKVADLVVVPPGSITITTSGKVRRASCIEQFRRPHRPRPGHGAADDLHLGRTWALRRPRQDPRPQLAHANARPCNGELLTVRLMNENQIQRFESACVSGGARFSGGVFACAGLVERELIGTDASYVITPTDTRRTPTELITTGWFTGLVPMSIPVAGWSFGQIASAAQKSFDSGPEVADVPFDAVVRLAPPEMGIRRLSRATS